MTYANLRLGNGAPLPKMQKVGSSLGIQDSLLGQGTWWNTPGLAG